MALAEVIQDIELSYRQFEFSIRLLSFCELGKIDPKEFDDDHIIALPEGTLHFPAGQFASKESIQHAAAIGVLITVGAMALAMDRGFEEIKVARDPKATDSTGRLRLLIYMIRCAYAHDVASPCWQARGDFQRQLIIDLDPNPLTLDLADVNGKPFNVEQIGGYYNWDRLYRMVLAILKS